MTTAGLWTEEGVPALVVKTRMTAANSLHSNVSSSPQQAEAPLTVSFFALWLGSRIGLGL